MATFTRTNQEQLEKAQDLLEGPATADLGFVKSLYFGGLRLDKILPYPAADPAEKARLDELRGRLETFLHEQVDPVRIDAEERVPPQVIEGLGKLGVLGMTVPAEYSGGGYSHRAYCRVLEQVGAWCASTAVVIGAHQSIGLKAIMLMGTEEQRRQYLPALARGELMAAFCLSEPEVGSDAANIQTRAVLSPDGRNWILNGDKKFATNAAFAGMLTVMAKTAVTDHGRSKDKVTAFLVTPDLPGFQVVSPNRSKCGIRGTWQATLHFSDMPVPANRVLGEIGKGLKVALSVLDFGRCTLSAGCLGSARRALELAVSRAKTRVQFDRPIGQFGLIKQKIARMAQTVFAMEAVLDVTCGLVDHHEQDVMLETAVCKLFCSEGLWQVADDTMQIWGGEGYMHDQGIERIWRDARVNRIVEGATEVMTAFIALIGIKGVGEELQRVVAAARHPRGNLKRLARFAGHEWRDLLRGHAAVPSHEGLGDEGRELARLTRRLARSVQRVCRIYREGLVDLQLIQQRIAGSAVELYAMACVLGRLNALRSGQSGDGEMLERDLAVGRAFCHSAAARVQGHLDRLLNPADEETLAVADRLLGWKAP